MTRRELAPHQPELQELNVLVVGLGRSGLAAARLAAGRGARVTVADARPAAELGGAVAEAQACGARVHAGGHPAELAAVAELVVVSPGVPGDIELLREARRRHLPIWGEIELAGRFCRGRVIGITGSNGKSTVTALTGAILRGAGIAGGTGGNLAIPFSDLLQHDAPDAIHAVELSSFQLEAVDAFRPAVGAILNLSPDHLDRYASFDAYAAAKARLLEVQSPDDAAILNADDAASRRFDGAVRGRRFTFSTRDEVARGAFVRDGTCVLRVEDREVELLEAEALPLPGEHNLANCLAAALACALVECPTQAIVAGLRQFRPLPHRLEPVATVRGVTYYNDSKATNPDSTLRALAAFPAGTVHLILGGKDKGADWTPLLSEIRQRATRVLLVGHAATMLEPLLVGTVPTLCCGTVARAVAEAGDAARPGDVVLLSPGCASFDQYRNFEERGEDFRRQVRALNQESHGDA